MQKNDGAARSKNKTNSTKMKTKKAVSVLATCLCMAVTANALAQSSDAGTEFFRSGPGRLHSAGERCRFIDLWSFRVNAADILFTVPNAGLEVDLSRTPYNRMSFGADVKYRWNYRQNPTNYLMNLLEVKPELKYWWRGNRDVSRFAWYAVLYANWGKYKYKFGPDHDGRDGKMYGGGVSLGFSRPLYQYRRAALDLEVGLSAGVLKARYDAYTTADGGYVTLPENSRDWHVLPYPVLSELRVAFVLRSLTVNDKYRKVKEQRLIRRQERRMR